MTQPASSGRKSSPSPLIVAHRGSSVAEVENTIAAFEAAVAHGAEAIELDVRWTVDDIAVVFHDPSITRNNRKIAVKKLAADELIRLKARDKIRVPLLSEVLQWAKDRVPLVFDIKDTRRENQFIDLIEEHGFHPDSVFSSFRLSLIGKIKALRPEWQTAWIIGNSGSTAARRLLVGPIITRAVRWGVGALHFHHSWIASELLARCHGEKMRVAAWTVDAPAEIGKFAELGVDAVITNVPDVARRALTEYHSGEAP